MTKFWQMPQVLTSNQLCCSFCKKERKFILEGPPDTSPLPKQSLGIIFYNRLQKWEHNKIAIVDVCHEHVRYKKLLRLSVKLAKKLNSIGIKKNEVLTIISHNQWKYLVTVMASFYIGAIVNPLDQSYSSGEIKHFLSICKPMIVFCSTKVFKKLISLREDPFYPTHVIIFDEETSGQTNFDNFLNDVDDDKMFTPVEADPKNDVAVIFTSSGTSDLPKCVQLTHFNFRLTMVYCGDPHFLNFNSQETTLGFLPFSHIFGNAVSLASILYGSKLVIMSHFEPKLFLELIEEHKVTNLYITPSIVLFLSTNPLVESYNLSSVNDVVCSAAPLARHLERMLAKILKIRAVRQMYGLTEVCGAVTVMPTHVKKYGSCGKVTTTHQVKVVNVETGKIVPYYQLGELRVKGGGIMKGYLHNEAETKAAFDEDGFLKTGDLGYYDEEGLVYYIDRLKEIIKYKDVQVSPAELENLLLNHPDVKEVGVIGKPDVTSGEIPFAFVVKQPNAFVTEEQLVNYVAQNMSPAKRLYGGVKFIDEMPKNSNGKILRRALRTML